MPNNTAVVKYNITDKAISEMKSLYMDLAITDLENQEEFDAVHSARIVVKSKRVEVEKKRKALKSDALVWGKKVDGEAKRIFGLLEPIESHLSAEEKKVTDEQKRIKEEADRLEREKIQARVDALLKLSVVKPFFEVAGMSDGEFDSVLLTAQTDYAFEQDRLAKEDAKKEEEEKRLAAERADLVFRKQAETRRHKMLDERFALLAEAGGVGLFKMDIIEEASDEIFDEMISEAREKQAEQDRIAKEQAEAQAEIDEANRKIEVDRKALEDGKKAEADKNEREAFEKQAAIDAKVQAEKDEKERSEREAQEEIERKDSEAAEAVRIIKLMPDKEKMLSWIELVRAVPRPEIKNHLANVQFSEAVTNVRITTEKLEKQIEGL